VTASDVATAWAAWDERPGDRPSAVAMIRACVALVGIERLCEFRVALVRHRRVGRHYRVSVDLALQDILAAPVPS
jgi:hypothetical protein